MVKITHDANYTSSCHGHAVVSANGWCTLALLPERPSESSLVSAPCGPRMGFGWQTLSLHFSLSFSPSVLFIVPGRRKPDFCRSSSDGETGRETERGGDRRGRQKLGGGIFQGKTRTQEGRSAEEGEQRRGGRWLAFLQGFTRACALGPESDGTFA